MDAGPLRQGRQLGMTKIVKEYGLLFRLALRDEIIKVLATRAVSNSHKRRTLSVHLIRALNSVRPK